MAIVSINIRVPCESVTTYIPTGEVNVEGITDVTRLVNQIQDHTTECEILDCFDEEQLTNYMQEKYGVTRMVK
jgi:uncharacterized membrane protein YjjP (DUF1212 family)